MINLPMESAETPIRETVFRPVPFADGYQAALNSAALFDIRTRAKIEVSGPDAPAFLSNLSTNDIKNLPLGGGCETYFLDHRAKTLFQVIAYHVLLGRKQHAIWLETTPQRGTALLQHLDRFLISEAVELSDVTENFAQFHLAGPNAKLIIESALGEEIPELDEFLHMERTFGSDSTCSIRRRTPLGVSGFDIVCLVEKAEGIARMLLAAGAKAADAQVYETLRIEAGTPVYGIDIDESRFVMEIGNVARAVSYTKGCFIGQEPIVMARDRAGHVNRAFLGLKVLEGSKPPAGTRITRDGQEVGVVTSSIDSPRLGRPIALAYVRRGHQEVGTRLEVQTPEGQQAVEVLGYPPVTA